MFNTYFQQKHTINCHGRLIDLSKPKIMGILNSTPDSFYSESRVSDSADMEKRIAQMLKDGADIIDVGGYSSRPGAAHVSEELEWERLERVLKTIRNSFTDVLVSVDTFRSGIAKRAVHEYQVDMINDISAGSMDVNMFETIARLKVPYIIMHMVGTPQNMQQNTQYEHLMREIVLYFAQKLEQLNRYQLADVIIDPGFGFSKTLDQNYELMAKLDEFKIFERPLLVGVSRKSMIYKFFNTSPQEALNGTTVLITLALQKGASILRVHDVKEAKESVELYLKTKQFC